MAGLLAPGGLPPTYSGLTPAVTALGNATPQRNPNPLNLAVGGPIYPNDPANGAKRTRTDPRFDGSAYEIDEQWDGATRQWKELDRRIAQSPSVTAAERQRILASQGETTQQHLASQPSSMSTSGGAVSGVGGGGGTTGAMTEEEWKRRQAYESELALKALREQATIAATESQTGRSRALEDRTANQAYIDKMMGTLGAGAGSAPSFDQGAYDLAFGRAKDQQARTISGAMAGLKNAMGARGLGGSGLEAADMAGIVGGGAANLGEFTREQAIQEVAGKNLAADRAVTSRGQNINLALSLSQLLNQGLRY
jgi:hypothetical protein